MYTILAINPGSTSTKLALFKDSDSVLTLTLEHSKEELAQFNGILAQFDFRKHIIMEAMRDAGVQISDLDAVIGRGGLVKPIKSGVYEVNEAMMYDLRNRPSGIHASNLGGLLAHDIAHEAGVKAYIADPVVVDEMQDVAHVTGMPGVERHAIFHALNQKAVARVYAESVGREYEDMNLIVAHMGGGISVGAHRRGEVVDVNNALDGEGPFSPDRLGGLPAVTVAEIVLREGYDLKQFAELVQQKSGLGAYFGINSVRDILKLVYDGDQKAKLIIDAMCYNIAKYIGSMSAVMKGDVDAIILTGGIAHNAYVCDYIEEMTGFVAKIVVYPGENELQALASNALRVLQGKLEPKEYK